MRGRPGGHISLVLSEVVQHDPGRCVGAGRPPENRVSRSGYPGRVQGMGSAETFGATKAGLKAVCPNLELYADGQEI